ncbi:MAG: hypothetical protein PHS97_03010 [Oscillospiraceae bacterium]|nr:hypothetical protein [Oscillospiraceae bacterium]
MSFPTIPDVNPAISLNFCDAVNLLLTSIAMEEISLSKLMDAEREKMQSVLSCCTCRETALCDLMRVNRSADDMLKTMAKLEMLLQFKLQDVRALLPRSADCPCQCEMDSCRPSPPSRCEYCLMGTGMGRIEGACAPCSGACAALYAFVPCRDSPRRTIRYAVGDGALQFCASGRGVEARCQGGDAPALLVCGTGQLTRICHEGTALVGAAAFTLTVQSAPCGSLAFRMQLTACAGSRLIHDSGLVSVCGAESDLRMACNTEK